MKLFLKVRRINAIILLAFVILSAAFMVSFFGALIRPDATLNADQQCLSIAQLPMGKEVKMIKFRKNIVAEEKPFWKLFFFGGLQNSWDYVAVDSFDINEGVVTIYEFSTRPYKRVLKKQLVDVLYHIDSVSKQVDESQLGFYREGDQFLVPASTVKSNFLDHHIIKKRFWLGTDHLGRDVLSRIMAGTIVTLSVGVLSVVISLLIGVVLGAIAGFYGSWIDAAIMWLVNVVWSIPTLLLVLAITFALGKGFWQIFIAVGLTMWVEVARVVRGEILSLKQQGFVQSAVALGMKKRRILFKHMIPSVWGPVFIISTANFATAILMESGLSFLGVGIQPPTPSWGRMIKENYGMLLTDAYHLVLLPGFGLMLMVLSVMILGNYVGNSIGWKRKKFWV